MADKPDFEFVTHAQKPSSALAIGGVWVVLAVLYLFYDAKLWILAVVGLFTIPAIIDIRRARSSFLRIGANSVEWQSGGRAPVQVTLAEIERVGVRLRLDMSRRVRLDMKDGQQIRIPPDCTPSGNGIEIAFGERDIPIRREFFGG